MNQAVLVCALCAVLSGSWLENVDAQLSSKHDSWSFIQSMETLSKVVEGLQTEIKMQSSVLNNLVSKEELESIFLNNLATKSDMEMQKISLQNLEAKAAMHDDSLRNLQVTVDELKTLLIKSSEKEEEILNSLSNLEAQSNNQTIMLNKIGEHLENQTSLMHNFFTKEEVQVNNLTNLEANATTTSDCVERLAEGIKNSTASKAIVEGIIAGTIGGVVIIPLNTREQRTISSGFTRGVAFNWQSRKVYWIENQVGIKIADLDGSHAELLIPGDPKLCGLAVDQITGNIYYGIMGSDARIRVCDSMGKKCVTVTSGVNNVGRSIWDIALLPSEGLMFWSSPWDASVYRGNMDGTNATTIISEDVYGLYLDEFTEKLYWANENNKSIGHRDLNGYNRNVLLNTTINPKDIAVDGDTLYFGGEGRPHGVYSVTSNGVSSIANTTWVRHIAMFGRDKVSSRPNPCKNSPCGNLCVLNRLSYTCL